MKNGIIFEINIKQAIRFKTFKMRKYKTIIENIHMRDFQTYLDSLVLSSALKEETISWK